MFGILRCDSNAPNVVLKCCNVIGCHVIIQIAVDSLMFCMFALICRCLEWCVIYFVPNKDGLQFVEKVRLLDCSCSQHSA